VNFFPHEPTGRSSPSVQGLTSDAQQQLLLNALRRANGAIVSYDELREAGIELPASVVSELELASVPIERRWQDSGGKRRLGVRLDPAFDQPDPASDPDHEASEDPLPQRGAPALATARAHDALANAKAEAAQLLGRVSLRSLVPIGLVLVAIVVAGVVVVELGAGRAHERTVAHRVRRAHAPAPAVASLKHTPTTPQSTSSTPQPAPTPVSPGLALQFEAQGHTLLNAGQYGQAVPVLERAVQATGEQLNECLDPVSETCLTYAYALYDLGRALTLDGDSTAAVPVLEQRLEIDNQRGVVQSELAAARASAS
jgi:tetratricopeptide (TPR) repeat protein